MTKSEVIEKLVKCRDVAKQDGQEAAFNYFNSAGEEEFRRTAVGCVQSYQAFSYALNMVRQIHACGMSGGGHEEPSGCPNPSPCEGCPVEDNGKRPEQNWPTDEDEKDDGDFQNRDF